MSKQINPYYVLGKLLEKSIDYDTVYEFVSKYISAAQRSGADTDEVVEKLKNGIIELNNALLDACVKLQGSLPKQTAKIDTTEWVTVMQAATIFSVSDVTIRNWIEDKTNPLPARNLGKRKTRISIRDLHKYIQEHGIKPRLK